jgi:hypothetical protein
MGKKLGFNSDERTRTEKIMLRGTVVPKWEEILKGCRIMLHDV